MRPSRDENRTGSRVMNVRAAAGVIATGLLLGVVSIATAADTATPPPTTPQPATATAPAKPAPATASTPAKPAAAPTTTAAKPAVSPVTSTTAVKPAPTTATAPAKPAPATATVSAKPAPATATAPVKPTTAPASVAPAPKTTPAVKPATAAPKSTTEATKPAGAPAPVNPVPNATPGTPVKSAVPSANVATTHPAPSAARAMGGSPAVKPVTGPLPSTTSAMKVTPTTSVKSSYQPLAHLDDQVTYQYNALGRRDPFMPMVGGTFIGSDVGGDAPVDIGGMKVVGIVWGTTDKFALAEDGRGNSLVLRVGDRVMNGEVEALRRDAVVVKLTVDGQTQSVAIPLTRKGEQTNGN